jgi:hypothetical protein
MAALRFTACSSRSSCRSSASACQSFAPSGVGTAAAPLATYPFPAPHQASYSTSAGLFASAIEGVLAHLSAAVAPSTEPFVQLSSLASSLGPHVRHSAHHWRDYEQATRAVAAEMRLFVSPVDTPEMFCSAIGASRDKCSQIDTAPPAGTQTIVQGSAGACCDEASSDHPDPHHHSHAEHHAAQAAARRVADAPDSLLDDAYASSHGLRVRYYGVVRQHRGGASADGCYLIKTVQQRDRSACRCMHYSLMRVCQGSALAEQAMGFWI